MMKEDYLHESDMFDKESNLKHYKTAFNWFAILISLEIFLAFAYLIVGVITNQIIKAGSDYELVGYLYKGIGYLSVIASLTLCVVALTKIRIPVGKVIVILLGAVKLIAFAYYQFVR